MQVVLETPRLWLREMSLADWDFLADLLADPHVMRYYPHCYSRPQAKQWIERQQQRYAADGHGLWLVCEKQSEQPIGQVGLVRQRIETEPETELGYMIAHPHWKQGFATEAALACRDYAFSELKRSALISLIRPVNIPSRRVAQRLGMTFQGRRVLHKGLEHWVYAINASEELGENQFERQSDSAAASR